ncbi:MAG: hypothetical protein PWP71_815, partial [Clostridia bacterium]|nr:hypothetical protein [Clostridia bacterium]
TVRGPHKGGFPVKAKLFKVVSALMALLLAGGANWKW